MKNKYFYEAELMIKCLPAVFKHKEFALKGGTALNLFIHDLPRLSVDIDLTYLPIEDRQTTLRNIDLSLKSITKEILRTTPNVKVQASKVNGITTKLIVSNMENNIKIEPNTLWRGNFLDTEERELRANAQEEFEMYVQSQILSPIELYGSKLCAALDRQHPRDIFDMKMLLETDGITDQILKSFIVYLAGHNRPIHELIDPTRIDIKNAYKNHFNGMQNISVTLQELYDVREEYIKITKENLSINDRNFLISLKEGKPKWSLIDFKGIEELPSLKWKVLNIKKMNKQKQIEYLEALKRKIY